jgi:hypothetical protein
MLPFLSVMMEPHHSFNCGKPDAGTKVRGLERFAKNSRKKGVINLLNNKIHYICGRLG